MMYLPEVFLAPRYLSSEIAAPSNEINLEFTGKGGLQLTSGLKFHYLKSFEAAIPDSPLFFIDSTELRVFNKHCGGFSLSLDYYRQETALVPECAFYFLDQEFERIPVFSYNAFDGVLKFKSEATFLSEAAFLKTTKFFGKCFFNSVQFNEAIEFTEPISINQVTFKQEVEFINPVRINEVTFKKGVEFLGAVTIANGFSVSGNVAFNTRPFFVQGASFSEAYSVDFFGKVNFNNETTYSYSPKIPVSYAKDEAMRSDFAELPFSKFVLYKDGLVDSYSTKKLVFSLSAPPSFSSSGVFCPPYEGYKQTAISIDSSGTLTLRAGFIYEISIIIYYKEYDSEDRLKKVFSFEELNSSGQQTGVVQDDVWATTERRFYASDATYNYRIVRGEMHRYIKADSTLYYGIFKHPASVSHFVYGYYDQWNAPTERSTSPYSFIDIKGIKRL